MAEAERFYRKGTEILDTDTPQAIELLTKSLKISPDAPAALYNRAVAYARVGRDSEAVADIDRLEKIAPETGRKLRAFMKLGAEGYVDIARDEFEAGNFKAAIEKCDSALAYDPGHSDARVIKGLAQKKLGNAVKGTR